MVLLAVETATRRGSLALSDADACYAVPGDAARTHGSRLPGAIVSFLASHQRRLTDLDALAVVTGPGSFTGLRIGLASVQGIAMASSLRVIGVPTFDALVTSWRLDHPESSATVAMMMDGARGDVYLSVHRVDAGEPVATSVQLIAPTVAKPDDAAAQIASLGAASTLRVTGDGVIRYRGAVEAALPGATIDPSPETLALGAAHWAATRVHDAVQPHALTPLYVRRPDAELARDRSRLRFARLATTEELAAVAALQRRSFTNAWGAEAIQWELDNTDVARLYVARAADDAIVAYCACWIVFDELHINSLAVEIDRRRQGIARRLLEYVLADAVSIGGRMATLEVRQSNLAARALYEGLGFKIEGVRRNYYQDPREDGLIFWHRSLATAGF